MEMSTGAKTCDMAVNNIPNMVVGNYQSPPLSHGDIPLQLGIMGETGEVPVPNFGEAVLLLKGEALSKMEFFVIDSGAWAAAILQKRQ